MSAKRQTLKGDSCAKTSNWRQWTAVMLTFAALLFAGSWWYWRAQPVPLPSIDLHRADPKVAAILRQRINEVRLNPRSAPAWGWLGALLWAYDFRSEGRECLARAERLDPSNPRWPYYRALSLLIATPNQAIPLLERTVRICGNNPETPRFRLAHLLGEQGRWEEARQQFEPVLAEHPQFAPARLLAARGAQARGDLGQALQLARLCTDDPRTARGALLLIATLSRQKGDVIEATSALQRSAKLSPDEGIADPFQTEVTLLRGDPRALSEQAHPLLAAGHLNEAAALIERLRQEHPDNPETWLLAGRLALLRKDLPAAEQLLQRHVEMSPHSAHGFFQLGMVLLARERWTDAAAAFQKATEHKRDFGPAYYNRGVALGRSGQFREAMEAFRESLRHNPERLESYLLLADLHMRMGEYGPALTLLEQARTINPDDPRVGTLGDRLRARKGN